MSKDAYTLEVAAQNGKPQRLVSIRREADGVLLRDELNVNLASARKRFRDSAAAKFGADNLDWLDDELVQLADEADLRADEALEEMSPPETLNQATQLVQLASGVELFHDADDEAFARFEVNGHFEIASLRTKLFRRWLTRQFYIAFAKVPGSQALHDAMGVLEGKAIFEGELRSVHVRVAEHKGKIYLDLCNAQWQVVEISASGWRILDESPVMFRRAKAMLPLPTPIEGGTVEELRSFINMSDNDWTLFLAWLIAALRPTGPYPILSIHGEHGCGKSSVCEMARDLLDPNTAALRSEPREPRDLMIASKNGWILALDNLSSIRVWLSDGLCRISTGSGFSTRTLYENDEETIFSAQRPIIVNGIEEVATRSDLLDRCLLLNLPPIEKSRRRSKRQLDEQFGLAKPRILGALLSAVTSAIHQLPHTSLPELPRMADFVLWATAAEKGLGLKPGQFLRAYQASRTNANETALESSPIGKVLIQFMDKTGNWSGTATELLECLAHLADEKLLKQKSWPGGPGQLSGALKRLAPNLREIGIEVEFDEEGRGNRKRRVIRLIRTEMDSSVPTVPSVPKKDNGNGGDDGDDVLQARSDSEVNELGTATSLEFKSGAHGDGGDAKLTHHSCAPPAQSPLRGLCTGRLSAVAQANDGEPLPGVPQE